MDLAYVVHTESCALLLDGEGVCRWVVPKDVESVRELATARRCIGAQFVATLDPEVRGLLGHEPSVGKTLLFASLASGRVALLRFGPISAFDTVGEGAEPEIESAPIVALDAPEPPPLPTRAVALPAKPEANVPPVSSAPRRSRDTLPGVAPPAATDAQVMTDFYLETPPSRSSAPLILELSDDDIVLETGSFTYDTSGTSPDIASFLQVVAASGDKPLDESDVSDDVTTGAFSRRLPPPLGRMAPPTRSMLPPVERSVARDRDSQVDIDTTTFTRGPHASDPVDDDQKKPSSWRPSGIMRRALEVSARQTERDGAMRTPSSDEIVIDADTADTLRFARAEGSVTRH